MKRKVEIGQIFDYLTVMECAGTRTFPSGGSKKTWRCRCRCGKEIIVVSGDLLNQKVKSCGCRKKIEAKKYNRVSVGEIYGR